MGLKRCLITGAGGLIGSHLVAALRGSWEVHAVGRRGSRPAPGHGGIHWYEVDLTDYSATQRLPREIDAVVYLAQSEYFREFPARAVEVFEVNTWQMVRFLDWARRSGARSFILASSGGVYGTTREKMSEEIEIPAGGNLGFYLGTKLCSEIMAENFSPFMSIVVLRFFFVYGRGQRRSMLIPRLVDRIRDGKQITLQGYDGLRLNPTHVADAVSAVRSALDLKGAHKINVGGPEVLSLREIAESIGRHLGKVPLIHVEPGASPRNMIADTTRMAELLQAPVVPFETGVADVL